jgi:hypothetical protein
MGALGMDWRRETAKKTTGSRVARWALYVIVLLVLVTIAFYWSSRATTSNLNQTTPVVVNSL